MKYLRNFSLTFLPIIAVVVLAVGVFAFVAEQTGLMSTDEFLDVFRDQADRLQGEDEESIQITDTTPLELEFNPLKRDIFENQTAFTIRSNKEIVLDASDRFTLYFAKQDDSLSMLSQAQDDNETEIQEDESGNSDLLAQSSMPFWYVVEANNIGVGESTLKFTIVDKAYAQAIASESEEIVIPDTATQQVEFVVNRVAFGLPFGADKIEDWPDSEYIAGSRSDLLLQITRNQKLADDYDPGPMVNVSSDLLLYANAADIQVREDVGESLKTMVLDLQNQTGKTLTIMSGYRSHNTQVQTYASNVASFGQEVADGFSARPGFSEHHLGTVVDFYSPDTGSELFSRNFDTTVAGQWLLDHAYKYGFVQTYPQGSEESTGYDYEPWQYRYIGIEHAQSLHDSGMIFSEWLASQ